MTTTRKGFALLSALIALVIVSALISATTFRIDADRRATRATTLHHRALAGAEDAIWRAVTTTNAKELRTTPIGTSTTTIAVTGPLTQTTSVTKLDTGIFWIIAQATVHQGPDSAVHRAALWTSLPNDTTTQNLIPLTSSAWADLY